MKKYNNNDISCKEKKIAIYVRNQNYGPSDYYRVIQYTNKMDITAVVHDALPDCFFRQNLNMKPSHVKKIYQGFFYVIIYFRRVIQLLSDFCSGVTMTIIQREVFPRLLPPLARLLLFHILGHSRIIWDFDDDIYDGEATLEERSFLEKESEKIIVTSEYLKRKITNNYWGKVIILPTSDCIANEEDIEEYIKKRSEVYPKKVNLVWTGTAVNLCNIDIINDALEKVGKELKACQRELILKVVCNRPYERISQNYTIKNIEWTRETAVEVIRSSHIGIMPLIESEYAMGKGGFKLIQYMSCGLAVVSSAVGFNKTIISDDGDGFCCFDQKEWEVAIRKLAFDIDEWHRYSMAAYDNYKRNYNRDINISVWNSIIL